MSEFNITFAPVSTPIAVTLSSQIGPPGPGLPSGGEIGQTIRKASADPYDTEWATLMKAGKIPAASFTGTPRVAAVVFTTPFEDGVEYSVTAIGVDGRVWSIDAQNEAGFTLNTNSDDALSGVVSWVAVVHGA